MALNLGSLLQASASWHPDRIALRSGTASESYRDLDRAARGIARGLAEQGLRPGDHVGLMLPNTLAFTRAYFGCLYAGLTIVPLNILLSEPEVAYHLTDSEAKLLIAHPQCARVAAAGADAAGVRWLLSEPDPSGDSEARRADPLPHLGELAAGPACEDLVARREDDTAVILYTSGTTGKPKGAELTHSNLLLNAALVLPRLIPVDHSDTALAVLPLFHSFGQTCIQNAMLSVGGCVVVMPRFTPEAALEVMQRERVTYFAGVPTMYFALLNHPGGDAYDLSRLRYCLSGGQAMPVEVMHAFEAKYRVQILEGYGLSETSPVSSFNALDRPRKPGSIGYPVWGVEMSILDDQDAALPDGEAGEICIRGHNIMKGYWKRPEATQESMRSGWFHSGDIGIRDADGSYRIVDRKKDMIIRGGFNVYPREVEEVLYAHPAIVEAAVIGVPHPSHGEEVKAVVALAPGATLSADELIAFTRERLAAYKYPRIVEFRDRLPVGPTGKILKRELS